MDSESYRKNKIDPGGRSGDQIGQVVVHLPVPPIPGMAKGSLWWTDVNPNHVVRGRTNGTTPDAQADLLEV